MYPAAIMYYGLPRISSGAYRVDGNQNIHQGSQRGP